MKAVELVVELPAATKLVVVQQTAAEDLNLMCGGFFGLFFLASEHFKCDWFSTRCFSHLSGSSSFRLRFTQAVPPPLLPLCSCLEPHFPSPFQLSYFRIEAGILWLPLWHCYCMKKKKRKKNMPVGTLPLWLEIWLSPGFSCTNSVEYSSDVTPGSCVCFCLQKNLSALQSSTLTYLPRRMERREAKKNTKKYIARMLLTFEAPEGMWKYFGGTYFRQIRAKFGLKMHACDQTNLKFVGIVLHQPAFCLLGQIN